MKTALCQTDIAWESKEENYKTAEKYIKEAAENGAALIVFPEMSFTGFSMKPERLGEKFETSETAEIIKKFAKENEIAVGFGMIVNENGKYLNRYVFIDKGGLIGFYDKIHPFTFGEEGKHYAGGNKLFSFEIEGVRVSSYICYDLRFPEIFSAGLKNSHLAIVAANWPESRIDQWSALLRARAIENQCYVAGVNRTGEGGGTPYNGRSAVFDCYGNILCEADSLEGLIYAEIDPDNVNSYRKSFNVRADRKGELYKKLLS